MTKTGPGPISIFLYVLLLFCTVGILVLFAGSEWQITKTRLELLPLRRSYIAVSCEPDIENDNRIVHIDCPLRGLHTFYPPADFAWNVGPFEGLFFEMKVEMLQWVVHSSLLGFSFNEEWKTSLIDSSKYPFLFYNAHTNPDFFPHIAGAGRQFARSVYGGGFQLHKKHLLDFKIKKQLELRDDGYYKAPQERPPTSVTYANTQLYQNALYTGNPLSPQVGDLRITFWGSAASHVSAMARQRNRLGGYFDLVGFNEQLSNGTVQELVFEGDYTPQELFDEYLKTRDPSCWTTWSIRTAFVIVLALLLAFTYRMVDKLPIVALSPLGIGSVLIASSIATLLVGLLRIMWSLWFGFICLVGSGVLLGLGLWLWLVGRRHVESRLLLSGGAGDRALELPPLLSGISGGSFGDAAATPSGSPTGANTRHFYQPV